MNCQQTSRVNARIAEANRRQALAACGLIEADEHFNDPVGALMIVALTHFVDTNSSNYERTFEETLANLPEGQRPSSLVINYAMGKFVHIMQWAFALAQSNRPERAFV